MILYAYYGIVQEYIISIYIKTYAN